MAYWLVKSEPTAYSFQQLLHERRVAWTGVRSAQARNNLAQMQPGDAVLIYHSVTEKAVVGLAQVVSAAHPDPTAPAGSPWLSADLEAVRALARPVSLAEIKADPRLGEIGLVRQTRLSVVPLAAAEFRALLELSELAPPISS